MRTAFRTDLALLSFLFFLSLSSSARADEARVTVAIDIIAASKSEGKSDEQVEKYRSQLSDFAYKSYKLLGARTVSVEKGGKQTVVLVAGKELTISFEKLETDGRAKLKLSIKGVVDTTVSLAPGGSVILGGPALPYGDGVLFVPVTRAK